MGAILGLATDQWSVIGVGLVVGVIGRWAYLMSSGQRVTWRECGIDVMMILPNGVLAVVFAVESDVNNARLLLSASMLGSGSTLAFVYARAQFLRWHGHGPPPPFTPIPPSDSIAPRNAAIGKRRVLTPRQSPVAQYGAKITPQTSLPGHDPDQDLLDRMPADDEPGQ